MPEKWTHEHLLYGLALLLALTLRLVWLNVPPLTNLEASWALQALSLAKDKSALVGAQPGYILVTSQLFQFITDSNFLARFWPALMGSLLVLVPYFFRSWLGRVPALLLAVGLALDPGLVALSRQAGGPILAAGFILLALGVWVGTRNATWTGIFAGLALLGGTALWSGLLILALAWLVHRFFASSPGEPDAPEIESFSPRGREWRIIALAAAATLLVAGTLFFQIPRGISAIGSSLAAYLAGWGSPSGLPVHIWLLTLALYQPVPLLLGIWGAFRSLRNGAALDRFFSLWLAAGLLIGVIYPGRSPADLVWVILPLWALGAREFGRHLRLDPDLRYPTLGVAALTVVILIFQAMNLARLASDLSANLPNQSYPQFGVAIVAGLALLILMGYLVAWGWSWRATGRGLLWGGLAVLAGYTLSASTSAAGMRALPTAELWQTSPVVEDIGLISGSVQDLSRWHSGEPGTVGIVVSGIDSPALQWALRFDPNYQVVASLSGQIDSSIVITPAEQQQPSLASSYRGQSILLSQAPDWKSSSVLDWLDWLLYRNSSGNPQKVILWARTDLFPGGSTTSAAGNRP